MSTKGKLLGQKPAHPTPEFYDEKLVGVAGGLTKREAFAMAALPAYAQLVAAVVSVATGAGVVTVAELMDPKEMAKEAVRVADALLEELAK